MLLDRLDQALAEVERHERTLAVLYLDLDRFKLINDSLGHHVGDRLLEAAGLVPSAEFIAVAEESGLIIPIGLWVLASACRQVAAWRRQGLACSRVAVNISARQLRHDALVAGIREALTKSGLDPADLDLEITESSLMHDTLRAGQVLEEIDALGVQLTMDDFGTGYSSLSYLKRFPLDRIKIDKTFVRDVPDDPDDVAIVQAIVAMAHQLRLRVVAEGVETPEQRAFLEDCGCDEIQGYLLGPPLPAEDFSALRQAVSERA
ncbi:MAG: putative bifunctional diguanylate cyclase/phosphodiesterase [Gammaproteobacteria bacterium]